MASKREKLRLRLQQALAAQELTAISEDLAIQLRQAVGEAGDRMWRRLLQQCGLPLAALVEGVRQDDFHSLERTLVALAQRYQQADPGDTHTRRRCRQLVIQARRHASLAARNPKVQQSRRLEKEEMALWMLIWLENPTIFQLWVTLRKPRIPYCNSTLST